MTPGLADSVLDGTFDALSDRYRRRLLLLLVEQESDDWISVIEPVSPPVLEVDEIRIRHIHLPKLDRAKLVDWDRERMAVKRGSNFDVIRPLLDELATLDSSEGVDP